MPREVNNDARVNGKAQLQNNSNRPEQRPLPFENYFDPRLNPDAPAFIPNFDYIPSSDAPSYRHVNDQQSVDQASVFGPYGIPNYVRTGPSSFSIPPFVVSSEPPPRPFSNLPFFVNSDPQPNTPIQYSPGGPMLMSNRIERLPSSMNYAESHGRSVAICPCRGLCLACSCSNQLMLTNSLTGRHPQVSLAGASRIENTGGQPSTSSHTQPSLLQGLPMKRTRPRKDQQASKSSLSTSGKCDRCTCNICFQNPKNCVILKCGHMYACLSCMGKLHDAHYARPTTNDKVRPFYCPVCREVVEEVQEVYTI